jgi:hypothetical protein
MLGPTVSSMSLYANVQPSRSFGLYLSMKAAAQTSLVPSGLRVSTAAYASERATSAVASGRWVVPFSFVHVSVFLNHSVVPS